MLDVGCLGAVGEYVPPSVALCAMEGRRIATPAHGAWVLGSPQKHEKVQNFWGGWRVELIRCSMLSVRCWTFDFLGFE